MAEQLKCSEKHDRLKEIAAAPTTTITFVCAAACIPLLISVVTHFFGFDVRLTFHHKKTNYGYFDMMSHSGNI